MFIVIGVIVVFNVIVIIVIVIRWLRAASARTPKARQMPAAAASDGCELWITADVCMCKCVYIYIYIHTYIHTYIHIYIYI